jgi:hypothetical protein
MGRPRLALSRLSWAEELRAGFGPGVARGRRGVCVYVCVYVCLSVCLSVCLGRSLSLPYETGREVGGVENRCADGAQVEVPFEDLVHPHKEERLLRERPPLRALSEATKAPPLPVPPPGPGHFFSPI